MSDEKIQSGLNGLEALLSSFSSLPKLERMKIMASKLERQGIADFYSTCYKSAREAEYTPEDINAFLNRIKIKDDQRDELGIYVSALANKLLTENGTININVGDKKLHFLGSFMSKGCINVSGNLGNFVCYEMSGGNANIFGNAGDFLALGMSGGTVNVHGYVGEKAGAEISNGEINMSKTSGLNAGEDSTGGSINGTGYASVGDNANAKLYVKGKQYPDATANFFSNRLFSRTTRKTVSRASLLSIIPSISLEAASYISNSQNVVYHNVAEDFFVAFGGFVLYGLAARAYVYAIPLYRQRRIDLISNNKYRTKNRIKNVFRAILDIADYLT